MEMVRVDSDKAKEYCLKYKNNIYAKCELAILEAFYYQNNIEENYLKLKKMLKKIWIGNRAYRCRLYLMLSSMADTLDCCEDVIKYGEKFLRYNKVEQAKIDIRIIYEINKIYIQKGDSQSIEILKQYIFNETLSYDLFIRSINCVGWYYYSKEEFEKVDDFFNKCYLTLNDNKTIAHIQLNLVSSFVKDSKQIKDAFKYWLKVADKEEVVKYFYSIYRRFVENNNDLTLEIIRELEENYLCNEDDKNRCLIAKAVAYFYASDYKKCHDTFNEIDNDFLINERYAFYLKGANICYLGDRRLYEEGIETLNTFIKLEDNTFEKEALKYLIDLYLLSYDYDNAEKVCDILEEKFKEVEYTSKAQCLASKGDYDGAVELLKEEYNKFSKVPVFYNYYKKEDDELSFIKFKEYEKGETSEDCRQLAVMHLHGFGLASEVNEDKALEYALRACEKEPYINCNKTILGNVYLHKKMYDKAFSLFEKGYIDYISYKDNCTCAVGFYCYCLALGLGVNQDENKAFEILEGIKKGNSDICVYTYAYLCLKKNKNLDDAYERLLSLNEWRYDEGKYFLLIRIAKKLGLDYKQYEEKFINNLKHLPIKEREHYSNNPEMFYLTNI